MHRYLIAIAITMGCGRLGFDTQVDDANRDATGDGVADTIAASYTQVVLDDSPIAYWRFEETTGTTANDAMGTYPGTFSGSLTRAAGIAGGRGAVFDGSTTRLLIGDVLAFPGNASYSLELWANPSLVNDSVRFLIDRSSSTMPTDGYQLYYAASFTLTSRSVASSEQGYSSAPGLTANRWTHIVATYDGADTALYIDGSLVNSSPAPALPAARPGAFAVGDSGAGQLRKYLGVLDEVAVYASALPAARVAAHAAAGR